jgi:hypothetical protein
MSWSTIYIHGRTGFKKAVEEKLKSSWLHGYPETELELMMFWQREESTLRDFKMAIGSKLIFKYRLEFFSSVDEYLQLEKKKPDTGFSKQENQLVRKMIKWQKGGSKKNGFTFPKRKKTEKV